MYRSIWFFIFAVSLAGDVYAQPAKSLSVKMERCGAGDHESCYAIGLSFLTGKQKNLKQAAKYHGKACDLGNWAACGSLGYAYRNGRGVGKNHKMATELFSKACENNDAYGCSALGVAYEQGLGQKKDLKKARSLYSKGCKLGNPPACENAGIEFENAKNHVEAGKHYLQACKGDEASSCAFLGDLYYHQRLGKGEKSDRKKAFKFASEACNRDLNQCANLAKYYFNGIGTPKNRIKAIPMYIKNCEIDGDACYRLGYAFEEEKKYEKARKFYQLGCEKKEAYACNDLALLYREGLGMKKNIKLTEHFFRIACHLKHDRACADIARMYREGKETGKNYELASIYFERACNLNHGPSCSELGSAHKHGRGVKKNKTKAATLYRKACNQGSKNGCGNLALAYEYGLGLKQDKKMALSLYKKACRLKSLVACDRVGDFLQREKKYKDAALFYQQACDGGNNESCRNLGALHENRRLPNPEKSIVYYKEACKKELQSACVSLGVLYKYGLFVEIDRKRANTIFESACPKSHYACLLLAEVLLTNPTTQKRTERAKKILQQICKEGWGNGCTQSHILLQKTGSKAEIKTAISYFERICKLGDSLCGELADSYRQGLGVQQDLKKSEALLKKTMSESLKICDEGSVYVCLIMGEMFQQFNKPQDAKKIYQKACKMGAKRACNLAKTIPPLKR